MLGSVMPVAISGSAALLYPDHAPPACGHAFACEYIATRARIAGFALELRAIAAFLGGLVGRIRRGDDLGCVRHEMQRRCRRILWIQRRKSRSHGVARHEANGR